jgi:polar amino acid transport system substrate-binding protein
VLALAACATPAPKEAVSDLAPTGKLRAAVYAGDAASLDLAQALARRLGVPLQLVAFDVRRDDWDVAFAAQAEGAYLVRAGSPIRENEDVDRTRHSVVVARGSAYDVFLSRRLRQAELVRTPTPAAVIDVFLEEEHDVAAGPKRELEAEAQRRRGLRLLPEPFMRVDRVIASRPGKEAGARYLRQFVDDAKR